MPCEIMPLTIGSQLGSHEIVALIGKGGMGEVYRARDTRLKREVALKVLPETFVQDAARMARFQREAEVLASLNHPNIATIYGVEDHALAMELVEGETLHGPLPIETAVNYARQIAEALEYAHDRGIIHRDLKPANVKVSYDGIVKLLDFGLAKAVDDPESSFENLSNSPTLTVSTTHTGTILGTAAYMSPEQAHGKAVDRRSDIFSFGSVLYEMLTGKPAFTGESIGDTLASVLKLEPDWTALPRETPDAIRKLLRRCLIKDRKQRLQAIGEARILLTAPKDEQAPSAIAKKVRALPLSVAAFITIVAIIALWGWFRRTPIVQRGVMRFTIAVPIGASGNGLIAFSRDGSTFAFVGGPQRQIYVRTLDQIDAKPIPGTEDSVALAFSPDGKSISYVSAPRTPASQLKKIAVDGSSAQTLAPAPTQQAAPSQSWAEDDTIYLSADGVLQRVPARGGTPEILATPDLKKVERFFNPQLLPGGKWLLYTISRPAAFASPEHQIAVLNLKTKESKILLRNAGIAQYIPTGPDRSIGHLIYYDSDSGSLMAAGFDVNQMEVKTSFVPVLEGVQRTAGSSGIFAVSESGDLAYVQGSGSTSGRVPVWVERDGTEQSIRAPARRYNGLRLSPDGQRVATSIPDSDPSRENVWVLDLGRGTLTRIPSESMVNINPIWTADGTRLIFASGDTPNSGLLAWAPADGSAMGSVLANLGDPGLANSVSPDHKFLVGHVRKINTGYYWFLALPDSLHGQAIPQSILHDKSTSGTAQFSPDSHWLAYQCDNEICIEGFPGAGGKQTVSAGGGSTPRWSRSGELFYRNREKLVAVEVKTTPTLQLGQPKVLFEKGSGESTAQLYDVSPDGKRFVMLLDKTRQEPQPGQLTIVLNWFEDVKQKISSK
jgi:serine/threonine-protein kinase